MSKQENSATFIINLLLSIVYALPTFLLGAFLTGPDTASNPDFVRYTFTQWLAEAPRTFSFVIPVVILIGAMAFVINLLLSSIAISTRANSMDIARRMTRLALAVSFCSALLGSMLVLL